MPSLVEGSEVSARLAPEIATAWGLAGRTISIAGGGGDNAASAIGVGATAPGEGFVSLGTSGVIFLSSTVSVSLPERTLHAFCHALPHRWHGMAVMLSAASSLAWIAAVLGREGDISELIAAAEPFARPSAAASAPIFLPYQRRAHAAQRCRGDRKVRGLRAEHGADAPSLWSWRATPSSSLMGSTSWTRRRAPIRPRRRWRSAIRIWAS